MDCEIEKPERERKQLIKKPHTSGRTNRREMRTNKKSTPYFERRIVPMTINFP